MYRCLADPNILSIKSSRSPDEFKLNLENFKRLLLMDKSIFSYNEYLSNIVSSINISQKEINPKLEKEDIYVELSNLLNQIEQIILTLFQNDQIILRTKVKDFDKFLKEVKNKFSKDFFDFILSNKKVDKDFTTLLSNKSNTVENFYLDNKKSRRKSILLSKNKAINSNSKFRKLINNFKDFEDIVLNNLGFNDLSAGEIYFVQPDLLRTIYLDKRENDKTCLKVFIKSFLIYFSEKYKNSNSKLKIYFISDETDRLGSYNDKNKLEYFKSQFNLDFFSPHSNKLDLAIKTVGRSLWTKKTSSQQRFLFSSNSHGFAFNIGFWFFGKRYSASKSLINELDINKIRQLQVVREGLAYENIDKEYLNLISSWKDSLKSPENPLNKLQEQLSKIYKN